MEGLVEGTCVQDCSFETKVRAGWDGGWEAIRAQMAQTAQAVLPAAGQWSWGVEVAERHVLYFYKPVCCSLGCRPARSRVALAHASPPQAPAPALSAMLAKSATRAPQGSPWYAWAAQHAHMRTSVAAVCSCLRQRSECSDGGIAYTSLPLCVQVNGACSADVVALGFVSPAVPEDEAGTQADASNNVGACQRRLVCTSGEWQCRPWYC